MLNIILILFGHFISDFVFQNDKQAINKSRSNYWLLLHVLSYSVGMLFISGCIFNAYKICITWTVINGTVHFIQDYITSRINAKLWQANKRHSFFISIGFDQFLHYVCLLISYEYLKQ